MSHVAPPGGFRTSLRGLAALLVLVVALALTTTAANAADLNATTSNFSSVYSSAQGGDVIHLATGNYGNWTPTASKSTVVTITTQQGATAQMYPTIYVPNLKLDGLTLNGAYLNGAKNLTIVNSTVTQMMRVDTPTSVPNANVLIDHNTFSGINVCSTCYEGRLAIRGYNNTQPVGVKVTNNLFGPGGDSDGVQIIGDAYGVQIGPGNEFRGLAQISTAHTDAIQLYGSSHTLITGNWLHDNSTGIMAPDGSDHETITNNTIQTTGYPWPIVMGNAVSNTITHNVLPGSGGTVEVDKSNGGAASSGNIITDNVMAGVTNASGGAPQGSTVDYNLVSGSKTGTHDIKGAPTYAGGSAPNSFAGYALASTSAGFTGASDGGAIGISADTTTTPPPTPPADTTAPDTTIGSGPTGGASTTDTTPTFAFSPSETGSTFECKVDTGSWATCTSPKTLATLAAGSHTFSVRATDAAGNTDASPATATFTVTAAAPPADTTAPETAITSGPTGGASTTDTTPSFAFTSTESGSTYQCKADNGSWATCTSPKTLATLAAGSHTFSVRATDGAGNTDGSPATATFTVTVAPPADTTAPNTSIASGPTGVTNDATPAFAFTASESGSAFQCKIDTGSWATCTSPATVAKLADGSHTFSVRATDGAGNTDASAASVAFTVDTQAPTTTITASPAQQSLSGDASVTFTSDDPSARHECRLDGGAWTACDSPSSVSDLAVGQHTLVVRSTDAAENVESPGASATWTVALPSLPPVTPPTDGGTTTPVPPVTVPTPPTTPTQPTQPTKPTPPATNHAPKVSLTRPTVGTRFTKTLTLAASAADDRGVQRVEFWVDGKRVASDTSAPYKISDWTAPNSLSNGSHTVVARAFDRSGAAASAAVTVVRVKSGSNAHSSAYDVWRATSDGSDAGTALHADGPARASAKVAVSRCTDAKGATVRTLTLRTGAAGTVVGDGLCVLSVRTAS